MTAKPQAKIREDRFYLVMRACPVGTSILSILFNTRVGILTYQPKHKYGSQMNKSQRFGSVANENYPVRATSSNTIPINLSHDTTTSCSRCQSGGNGSAFMKDWFEQIILTEERMGKNSTATTSTRDD